MNNSDNLKQNTKTLQQYFYNACATYYGALGHCKSDQNERLADMYHKELTKRGVHMLPICGEAANLGTFNGEGSY
jgi:hypothetical protein